MLAGAFATLANVARDNGWKVDGWGLHYGSETYSYAYRISYGVDDTPYSRPLGYSAREAYVTLWSVIDALYTCQRVREEQNNVERMVSVH